MNQGMLGEVEAMIDIRGGNSHLQAKDIVPEIRDTTRGISLPEVLTGITTNLTGTKEGTITTKDLQLGALLHPTSEMSNCPKEKEAEAGSTDAIAEIQAVNPTIGGMGKATIIIEAVGTIIQETGIISEAIAHQAIATTKVHTIRIEVFQKMATMQGQSNPQIRRGLLSLIRNFLTGISHLQT